jgi:hypothetical protein
VSSPPPPRSAGPLVDALGVAPPDIREMV